MDLQRLLTPARVILNLRAADKRALLQDLAGRIAPSAGLEREAVLAALLAREELGSTGVGRGFALPHARLDRLENFVGLFARLAAPITFDAIDEQPVDLVFLLLIPGQAANEHLAVLAAISRRMRDPACARRLRQAASEAEAYDILTAAEA
jgi:PTS system nitrogen regulatory IIA component